MCGINGIFAWHDAAAAPTETELLATREDMRARGPDGCGAWWTEDRRCALGHRRLAIIDLSERAAQPMLSADGKYAVTFNGEIYNYPALRAELEAQGARFRTTSDTEVLLHLYARHGAEMVQHLRGMFTFAIWDGEKRGLFLARDPYGIKPLYTANDGLTFRFASQVKALLAGGQVSREIEPAGIAGFHLFGSVPAPFTLYRDIREFPAGHTQWIDSDGPRAPRQFANLAEILANGFDARMSQEEMFETVRAGARDSVAAHLIADVEVGIFLSGGSDSCALLGLIRDAGKNNIRAITIGFDDFTGTAEDEVPLASVVVRLYGAGHIVRRVSRQEFEQDLPRIMEAMDQPSIDGVNSWFASKTAAEAGLKVAISGLGGDELLAGYPSFTDLPNWRRRYGAIASVPLMGRAMRMILSNMMPGLHRRKPKAEAVLEYAATLPGRYLLRRGIFLPHELPALIGKDLAHEGLQRLKVEESLAAQLRPDPRSDNGKICVLESENYMRNQLLRDADWASMAHSVEMRTPLVDIKLLKALAGVIPHMKSGSGKAMLRAAPATPLPEAIGAREKTGFTIPAWAFGVTATSAKRNRGIEARNWAKTVVRTLNSTNRQERQAGACVLALVTDAYGGFGGISRFNRDFLGALGSLSSIHQITVLPRVMSGPIEESMPATIDFDASSAKGKRAFVMRSLAQLGKGRSCDLVVCGHINLLPIAYFLAKRSRARLVLVIHGIDAWQRHKNPLTAHLARKIDGLIAVSNYSAERFLGWSKARPARKYILPNCVNVHRFQPGPKNPDLVKRYGLGNSKVLMTFGRLAGKERRKGFDRTMEALPEILRYHGDVKYLIAGDGDDRPRLEAKAKALGVTQNVIFTGRLSEEEKVDHYNLCDIYVMPSSGEGFGIVLIEAAACGVPVIGSNGDGSREALLGGRLGTLVDPLDREALVRAIVGMLDRLPPRERNPLVETFGTDRFRARVQEWLDAELAA